MGYAKKIKNDISGLVRDFQKNPFDYLYEADLQAALFSRAYSSFSENRIKLSGGYHDKRFYPQDRELTTIPVKCEYPGSQRFDVAFICPDSSEKYDQERWRKEGWKNDRFWELPVSAAIELKYMQLGDKPNYKVRGFKNDIEKLDRYGRSVKNFLGVSILFIQSDQQYSETHCSGMTKLESVDEEESGVFGLLVGPSSTSWYKRLTIR